MKNKPSFKKKSEIGKRKCQGRYEEPIELKKHAVLAFAINNSYMREVRRQSLKYFKMTSNIDITLHVCAFSTLWIFINSHT